MSKATFKPNWPNRSFELLPLAIGSVVN